VKEVEKVTSEADRLASASTDTFANVLRDAAAQVAALRQHLTRLVSVQVDRARVGVQQAVVNLVLFAWLGLIAFSLSVLAVYYAMSGLVLGLAILFGGRIWAAQIAAGSLILGVMLGGALVGRAWVRKRQLKALVRKYDKLPEDKP
jgi:hypothetical protein